LFVPSWVIPVIGTSVSLSN